MALILWKYNIVDCHKVQNSKKSFPSKQSHIGRMILYIFGDDIEVFYNHYGNIFTDGVYNNEERGPVDLCGINFYSREQSTLIIDRINTKTPPDYQVLLNWLRSGEHYIGFYILGL